MPCSNPMIQPRNLHLIALTLFLVTLSITLQAALRYETGVYNSDGPHCLNPSQLRELQTSLREKSGFAELHFDEQGALKLGNRQHLEGGSPTVRALLIAAVESANRYELESYEHSPELAFARIRSGETLGNVRTGQRVNIFHLQLDFSDFKWLIGSREVRASFDPGMIVMHELIHGVLGLKDPIGQLRQIGDCDTRVNQMRRELNLPERLFYYPNKTTKFYNGDRVIHVTLQFIRRDEVTAKIIKSDELFWELRKVAPNAPMIAIMDQGIAGKR